MSIVDHFYVPTSVRASPGAAIDARDNNDNAIALRRRAAGSAFFSAMQLLPVQRREAMRALYAFCREVDDIADGDASRSFGPVERLFAGKLAYVGTVLRCDLQRQVTVVTNSFASNISV